MQRLKEKLFLEVSSVLEPSRLHPPGRWQEAWHRASRFLNRRPGHTEAHQLELQNKLYELHAAISSSIEAEVCLQCWGFINMLCALNMHCACFDISALWLMLDRTQCECWMLSQSKGMLQIRPLCPPAMQVLLHSVSYMSTCPSCHQFNINGTAFSSIAIVHL